MAAKKLARAKLFQNGRSQAVRLPKEFRFPGDEVTLRRDGDAVIMEPIRKRAWPRGYWDRLRENQRYAVDAEPLAVKLLAADAEDDIDP